MSYGISVRNDDNYLQVDSEIPRLCSIAEGTFYGIESAGVGFSPIITTQEPPCIFIRPYADSPDHPYRSTRVEGSPGNWTGFTIDSAVSGQIVSGTWFAAVFRSTANSLYGMKIWDPASNEIYDSGSPFVTVSSCASQWIYAGSQSTQYGTYYSYHCPLPAPVGPNDHYMINPFSRWQNSGSPNVALPTGVVMSRANQRLMMWVVGVGSLGPVVDIGSIAAVIARIKR